MEPLVEVTRGDLVECIHYGDIAVCDRSGDLIGSVGDPSRRIYWRSSAKPIQALTVVETGAADRFGLTAKELAVCCASHSGSAEHVETVRSVLAKAGVDESALQCGTHMPGDEEERRRLICGGLAPLPVHNNCSGKHAGMLAATKALGLKVDKYLSLESPVQQLILRNMLLLSGVEMAQMTISVDGCGAPTHGMSLQGMATAYARVTCPDDMPDEIQEAAPRIIAAMAAEPVMVSSRGSFNSELLAAYGGRIVAKGGAEGLFTFGLTDLGIGVAARIRDGSSRGQSSVVLRILEQLGAIDDGVRGKLERFFAPPVSNCHGATVGEIRAAEFSIEAADG